MNLPKYTIIALPYRDAYFERRFGPGVRDLMILKALARSPRVHKVLALNRTVSLFERIYRKPLPLTSDTDHEIEFLDATSLDVLGPLRGRAWTVHCYAVYAEKLKALLEQESNPIVLDFTPMADVISLIGESTAYWYDIIDNFKKHNRFSDKEKELVKIKWKQVASRANIITGVTRQAVAEIDGHNKFEFRNVLLEALPMQASVATPFDFGFLGFLTNKFDLEFLADLLEMGPYTAAIFGDSFDPKVSRTLRRMHRVKVFGKFDARQVPHLMTKFRIGLINYRTQMNHDGFPLKLFQYLICGKPVIATENYGLNPQESRFVFTATEQTKAQLPEWVATMLNQLKSGTLKPDIICTTVPKHAFWIHNIAQIILEIDKIDR